MYGQFYILEGQDFDKAIDMLEEARYLLPADLGIRLNLAEAYVGGGRLEDARATANSILPWTREKSQMADRANTILEQIESKAPRTPSEQAVDSKSKDSQ